MYLSPEPVGVVPTGVVTVMSTVPADSAGAVALIWVALTITNVAFVAPNLTAVALRKFVPVIVTVVPPPSGPADGLIVLTVGGAE